MKAILTYLEHSGGTKFYRVLSVVSPKYALGDNTHSAGTYVGFTAFNWGRMGDHGKLNKSEFSENHASMAIAVDGKTSQVVAQTRKKIARGYILREQDVGWMESDIIRRHVSQMRYFDLIDWWLGIHNSTLSDKRVDLENDPLGLINIPPAIKQIQLIEDWGTW